jgi:hypothetical protein
MDDRLTVRRALSGQVSHDHGSDSSEQLGLLRGELVLGERSLVAERGELCDLLGHVGLCWGHSGELCDLPDEASWCCGVGAAGWGVAGHSRSGGPRAGSPAVTLLASSTVNGGHASAQASVQVGAPWASGMNK